MPATRSYSCTECIETFSTQSAQRRHLKTAHGEAGRCVCEYCNMTLSDTSVKSRHITESHTERPPLFCTECAFKTKRPGDLKNHYRDRHGQVIVIPRRPRRTKAEIVVKRPVATQALDYNSGSVTFAPPVMGGAMIAPPLVDLAQHNQFTEQYQMSYQTTPHDSLSFDWFSSQLDSSPSPSPISTSSSTPLVSTPLNAPDWLMGALGWSKSPLPVPSDPLSTLHCSGEWDPFTFGF